MNKSRPQSCPYVVMMQPVLKDGQIDHWLAHIREYDIQIEGSSALATISRARAEALLRMQRDFDLGKPLPNVLSLEHDGT